MPSVDPESPPPEPTPQATRPRRPRKARPVDSESPRSPGQRVTTKVETSKAPAETPEETSARVTRENAEHAQKLWERKLIVGIGLGIVVLDFLIALSILCVSSDSQLKTWSLATITNLVPTFVAYVLGREQGAKSSRP